VQGGAGGTVVEVARGEGGGRLCKKVGNGASAKR